MATVVNCAAYENGRRVTDLDINDPEQMKPRAGRVIWIGLHEPTQDVLVKLQGYFGLHDLAVEDAYRAHQRPKLEVYGETLFVVMKTVEMVDGALNVGEVDIFVGPNYVLSVRKNSEQGFISVRERCESEPELLRQGSGFVLYALMDAVVDRYFPIIDTLESDLEAIEAKIFSQARGVARANIEALYQLKSKVTVLKHAVAPLFDASSRLYGGRTPGVCANTQEYFRDVSDHLARVNSSIDTMRDTISTAMAVNLSMVTIEENEVTKRLAAWAGIFAVITAFAGIWGMNFEFMPELKSPWGYPAAMGLISVSCGIMYWRFRKSGWL